MENTIIIVIAVFTVLALGILLITARYMRRETGQGESGFVSSRQGQGVGTGIAIGAGFGVALGLVIGHLALGIPIGAAIGSVLGGIWERGNRIQPITRKERRWFKWLSAIGVLVLTTGLVCFLMIR
jgi:hypothetical protein